MDNKELLERIKKGIRDDLNLIDRYIDLLNSNSWVKENCAEHFRNQLMMLNAKYSLIIDGSDQTRANPFTLREPLGQVKGLNLDNEIDAEKVLRYYRLIIQDVVDKMELVGDGAFEEMTKILESGKMPTQEELAQMRPEIKLEDDNISDDEDDIDLSKLN